jgi:hypothetical protein
MTLRTIQGFRHELAIVVNTNQLGLYRRWRPNTARALGCVLLPATITNAWYDQECPTYVDTTNIPRIDRVRWQLSRVLRGVQ